MDANKTDALVDVIRAILGPSDRNLSKERILALLAAAGNDPNKAVDLYFQAEAANGAEFKQNDVEGDADDEDATADWPPQAAELSDLLGGDVKKPIILDLLRRTNSNLQKAVEIYFVEHGADGDEDESSDEEDDGDDGKAARAVPTPAPAPSHNALFPAPAPRASASTEPATSSTELPPTPSVATPIAAQPLEPLHQPEAIAASDAAHSEPARSDSDAAVDPANTVPAAVDDALKGPGTYEVTITDGKVKWQIGVVFGRAVVQKVDPGGPAGLAGVHKSDVLLSFRDTVLTDKNCAAVAQELSGEKANKETLKAEIDIDELPVHHKEDIDIDIDDDLPEPPKKEAVAVPEQPKDDIDIDDLPEHHDEAKPDAQLPATNESDVVMEELVDDVGLLDDVEPKYGLQTLCRAVEAMVEAIGDSSVEFKVIVDLLLLAEFSLDRAVNNFLNEDRLASDFRRVVGYNWDPANPAVCWGGKVYAATIPAGPLGLTVENILERTIVVDIKPGGAAERAAVKRSSWLVALNGVEITRLTHKETLRMIETAARPLQLQLIVVPQEEYKTLRKQLSMNIRQQKTERPVPEQDRMSFRVFQLKIHQAVLVFPKAVAVALFQYLSAEEYHPPTLDSSYPNPLNQFIASSEAWELILLQETRLLQEERSGEMCTERRFLLNLFSQIHEYDDKGESTVIRTIQFLGWLAKRAAEMKQFASTKSGVAKFPTIGLFEQRYTLLLSVILHVLESLSIIENHATWDVMVSAFKMVILSLADSDVGSFIVPMMARHSISSSPTARIVPISLVAMVYAHVSDDVPVQLRGMFERMCSDDNPLVRRAVTSVIADLAIAAGPSTAAWTVQLLERATADSHDIVRIFAVKSCIQLATNLRTILSTKPNVTSDEAEQALKLLYVQMVPMVNTYASDSSWQVRLEAARTLPAFCRAFGAEYADIFVDHFVAMVRDPTVEVRKACAEGGYLLSDVLVELALRREASAASGVDELETLKRLSLKDSTDEFVVAAQAKIMRSVLPATYRLATDVSVAVRQALAKTVGKSLQLVGGAYYDDLVPIFAELLDENQDANVRAALLEEVVRHFESASETIGSMIFPVLHSLRASPQWRVRVKFVQCVGSWAARTDGAVVPLEFADGCLQLLVDAVHDVRAAVCSTLPVLVKSLGRDWLAEKGVPRVTACLAATFHARVTGLAALELLASELKDIEKLRDVIEIVAAECTSKTANLRFRALRTLGVLVPALNDPTTTENTLEIVWDLARAEREADPDVREAADATRVVLEALVG
ncbi:hypothetical protein PybrP1_011444 [[Pythium] brassicae (nom. inval.)]|nr:hypothetical protein PybrP1_011444 [[Pythium] brassicae (nom. inval.)]